MSEDYVHGYSAAEMRRLGAPMIFNHEDWGLSAFALKETVVRGKAKRFP